MYPRQLPKVVTSVFYKQTKKRPRRGSPKAEKKTAALFSVLLDANIISWVFGNVGLPQFLAITVVSKGMLEGLPWENRKPPLKPCLIFKGDSMEVGLSKRAQFTWAVLDSQMVQKQDWQGLGLQHGIASLSRSPG